MAGHAGSSALRSTVAPRSTLAVSDETRSLRELRRHAGASKSGPGSAARDATG
eukprot:CAMPEP_0180222966 /NCGR_PEP_ID=MMETSP0987-20121128/21084_1 /TAXON_ID=697907 /ORGANISM="non described non described, Strain CCMP2293" /LENGTH=52 /DNA_ID=CAMNT_0022185273 /DNA_START=8 /DNA_END=166 /DNA_ORIENTATION=-